MLVLSDLVCDLRIWGTRESSGLARDSPRTRSVRQGRTRRGDSDKKPLGKPTVDIESNSPKEMAAMRPRVGG